MKADKSVGQGLINGTGMESYVESQYDMIKEVVQKNLYYDYYIRRVELNIDPNDMTLEIITVNEILIKNFQLGVNAYNPSPVFETEDQARSYKHLQLIINDDDRKDIISSAVVKRPGDVQLPYAVHNQFNYSDYKESNELHIYHKYSYKRADMNFFMHYQLRVPCRELSIVVHLNNDLENAFKILAFVFAPLPDPQKSNWRKEIYSDSHSSNIACYEWTSPGNGFNIFLIKK